jgi:hypothetical protein
MGFTSAELDRRTLHRRAVEADRKENWIPTKPGGAFEALFRFYGPEGPLVDKCRQLPDIQRAN